MTGHEKVRADWAASDASDVAAFVGPNADAFREVYEKGREKMAGKGGVAFGWSWPAFLFGYAWFFYRKQWVAGAVLLIVPIVALLLVEGPTGVAAVAVITAMFAKWVVVQDGVTKIAKIKAGGGGRAEIAAAGGVSKVGGAIGGTILLLSVLAAISERLGST